MRKQQQGMSFFGLMFVIAIIAGIVTIAVKVVPPYLDFMSVSQVTKDVINQPRVILRANDEIMRRIGNQLSINNIRLNELGKDPIKLSRKDGVLTASIDYYVDKPVFKSDEVNIMISMHFTKAHEATNKE